ncbi:hypothetical protein LZP69_01810 [Shewanella sp. AS1]|uniref:DUF6776 family protein n=1 Tax=Shewanella sp. AS1 TaxID=2907626 RepID=UPI001F410E51|nr:DUF6776 family protein [Shewanella sp. AS1]MCE9677929.1 hypothetical protein [Shewanella sp. AS1]
MLNYHRWVDRMQVLERKIRPSNAYLLCLVIVAFLIGVLTWDIWQSYYPRDKAWDNAQEAELRQALTSQAEVLAARNLELSVEREANANMQQMFTQQYQKRKELERELAFYRSIMAPEHQADGVAINGLEMINGLLDGQFRLKLVLTQLQKRKQAVKGDVTLTFVGVQAGEAKHIALSSLIDDKLSFSFKYFQVLEAEVTLPSDFELSRVEVKVVVPSTRWRKGATAEQVFSAQELLNITESTSEDIATEEEASPQFDEPMLQEGLPKQ